jgi:hypothetical protein
VEAQQGGIPCARSGTGGFEAPVNGLSYAAGGGGGGVRRQTSTMLATTRSAWNRSFGAIFSSKKRIAVRATLLGGG